MNCSHHPTRLVRAQRTSKEQSGGNIGGGDPEDCGLQMPDAKQVAGKNAIQLEAVKAAWIGTVVCDPAADQRLDQEQQRYHDKELDQRALARTRVSGNHLRVHMVTACYPA